MRQLIYVSTAPRQDTPVDAEAILRVSRHNNARDGLTGLLYADGRRFLQVLEGEEIAVAATIARIERDPRHRAIVRLSDRTIATREFGDWSMAHRAPGKDATSFINQVAALVADASPTVQATFNGFAEHRAAA